MSFIRERSRARFTGPRERGPEKSRPGEGWARFYRGRRERGVVNLGGRRVFLIWWSFRVSWGTVSPAPRKAGRLGWVQSPQVSSWNWVVRNVSRAVSGTGWSGEFRSDATCESDCVPLPRASWPYTYFR